MIKSIKTFLKNKNILNLKKKYNSNSVNSVYDFKIIWPNKTTKINNKEKRIANIKSYDEFLKIKKEDFIKTFKNVLITLDYDVKLDDKFKEDQFNQGMHMLYNNSTDVIPLSSTLLHDIQTKDILKIFCEQNSKKLVLGKIETKLPKETNKIENSTENDNEEDSENSTNLKYYQHKLKRFNEDEYPEEFKVIIKKFTEYLENSKYPSRSGLQYYNKTWNWHQIEMRKSHINRDLMLIIDFNPQNLTEDQIQTEMSNLKQYFNDGPGRECNLTSLYFHILNPSKEIDDDNTKFNLLFGSPYISNQIHEKMFKFFAQNFYPDIYEVYQKLNMTLLNLIKYSNENNKTDIVVEIDGANGILASLSKSCSKKFYAIQQYNQSVSSLEQNVLLNSLESNEYFKTFYKFTKSFAHMKTILTENNENSRICIIFQSFDKLMVKYESKAKRDLLIRLRKYPQVKSIILVSNLKTKFKIENYCYELMTGERINKELFGNPFKATKAILIDSKPMSFHCTVVIYLERD